MSVAENVAVVAGYPRWRGLISWAATRAAAAQAIQRMGGGVDPNARVGDLSAAEKSIVAIARAMAVNCDLLVLDEPSAALPEADVARLLDVLQQAERKRRRNSLRHAPTRRGLPDRRSGHGPSRWSPRGDRTRRRHRSARPDLRNRRSLALQPLPSPARARRGHRALSEGSRRGGRRTDLIPALASRRNPGTCGTARRRSRDSRSRCFRRRCRSRADHVSLTGAAFRAPSRPENAMAGGSDLSRASEARRVVAPNMSVRENLYMNPMAAGAESGSRSARPRSVARCLRVLRRFSVRAADPERPVGNLSGGNQQKVVVARWFEAGSRLVGAGGADFRGRRRLQGGNLSDIARGARARSRGAADLVGLRGGRGHVPSRAVFDRGRVDGRTDADELSIARLTALAAGGDESKIQARLA